MLLLQFEDRYGRYRPVAEIASYQDAAREISIFLNQYNFKSYYTRNWIRELEDGGCRLMFDVGSHSEFFCIYFENKIEAEQFLKDGFKNENQTEAN
jgi:hypothetical protein